MQILEVWYHSVSSEEVHIFMILGCANAMHILETKSGRPSFEIALIKILTNALDCGKSKNIERQTYCRR